MRVNPESSDNGTVLMEKNVTRIFVVDNQPLLSSNLAHMLRAAGFAAEAFTNSYEVLATVAVRKPDLLIAEIMMPLISGLQLSECLKLHCPNCKVIFMSGQVTTRDLSVPPDKIIVKPLRFRDLLYTIEELGMFRNMEGSSKPEPPGLVVQSLTSKGTIGSLS